MTQQERDQKKLDLITEAFVRALIRNEFEDIGRYAELTQRLASLIDLEIKQKLQYEKNAELIQFWPNGSLN